MSLSSSQCKCKPDAQIEDDEEKQELLVFQLSVFGIIIRLSRECRVLLSRQAIDSQRKDFCIGASSEFRCFSRSPALHEIRWVACTCTYVCTYSRTRARGSCSNIRNSFKNHGMVHCRTKSALALVKTGGLLPRQGIRHINSVFPLLPPGFIPSFSSLSQSSTIICCFLW